MRNVILPLAFALASPSLVACSFHASAGTGTNTPAASNASPTPSAAPPATTAPAQPSATPIRRLGKRPTPTPTSSSTETSSTTPTTTTPAGVPVVTATTAFGSSTIDPTGFKGTIFWVDKNTTKIPPLASMKPAGFVFTKELNVAPQTFGGFPGVDASRNQYFAIRYEAPLIVTAEADYDFRVVSDDAAILLIDNMPIVDNDGVRASAAEKTGPVHLVPGTHLITVDYLQTNGNVALQVYCKKVNETEKVCPTQL